MRFLHLFEISIPFQCACLCLPMCTNLYAYEYLPIFAYKCVPTYMPLSTYLYLPTYVYLPMCTCKCVPTNVYLPVCTYQCVLTSVYLPMCASVFHECLIRPRSCFLRLEFKRFANEKRLQRGDTFRRWHRHKSNLEFWYLDTNTKGTIFIDKIYHPILRILTVQSNRADSTGFPVLQ